MWLVFLKYFNGQRYFQNSSWHHSNVLQLFTDSAGKSQLGCGAFFKGQCFFFSLACSLAWMFDYERHNVVGIDTNGSGNFHMGQSI